jgi:uncharacterized SAM-binding protein YcdF (DUF218 family)
MNTLLLTKFLALFVYPLGAAILVGAIALALSFTDWRRVAQVLLGLALVSLWVAATPVFANWLTWRLESQFPPVSIETLPQSDVVIVLGGILGQPLPPRRAADLNDSADRIMHAWRIYRAGKASLFVISAGNLPWEEVAAPEAQLIADLLVELGAPRSALVLETESRNTRENAVNTAAIFKEYGWRTGLLVTSGAHMPRALAAFQKVGLALTPAATDIRASPPHVSNLLDLLPDADALAGTTSAIKEMIGLLVYRALGWA